MPSTIIQRTKISEMAINGQITEHGRGGMPLENVRNNTKQETSSVWNIAYNSFYTICKMPDALNSLLSQILLSML